MLRRFFVLGGALTAASPAVAGLLWHGPVGEARRPADLRIRVSIRPPGGAPSWAQASTRVADTDSGWLFMPWVTSDSGLTSAGTAALTTAPPAVFQIAWGTIEAEAARRPAVRSRLSQLMRDHTPVILVPAATATVLFGAALLAAMRRR